MVILAGLLIVLIAIPASLAAERFLRPLLVLGAAALLLGVAGFAFISVGPKDYLVRFPALSSILHPYVIALLGGLAVIFGLGLLLGLLARVVLRSSSRKPPES